MSQSYTTLLEGLRPLLQGLAEDCWEDYELNVEEYHGRVTLSAYAKGDDAMAKTASDTSKEDARKDFRELVATALPKFNSACGSLGFDKILTHSYTHYNGFVIEGRFER
jgi:hypothetical protein